MSRTSLSRRQFLQIIAVGGVAGLTTKFSLGSIGKTFTGVLIMQLVEQGQIKLSDPLEKYLPEFPFPEKADCIGWLEFSSNIGYLRDSCPLGQGSLQREKVTHPACPFETL